MKTQPLVPHLTVEELERAYRAATRAIERSRWQILWLKSKGKTPREIVDATGYNRNTISTLIRNYNQHGPGAVRDKRQDNRSELALNPEQRQHLWHALQSEPPMGGVWTSGKVQRYVQEHFDVHITDVCAWGYFKRLGFSVQMPRPRHHRAATVEEQAAFKKK